jgi:hypothetical protein
MNVTRICPMTRVVPGLKCLMSSPEKRGEVIAAEIENRAVLTPYKPFVDIFDCRA